MSPSLPLQRLGPSGADHSRPVRHTGTYTRLLQPQNPGHLGWQRLERSPVSISPGRGFPSSTSYSLSTYVGNSLKTGLFCVSAGSCRLRPRGWGWEGGCERKGARRKDTQALRRFLRRSARSPTTQERHTGSGSGCPPRRPRLVEVLPPCGRFWEQHR